MISPDYITHEEIRLRAFEIWEQRGRPEGLHVEIWLQAENDERAKRDAISASATDSGRAAE